MKKLFSFLVIALFFSSCGPKRLGCGPYRCEVKPEKTKTINTSSTLKFTKLS